jgi:hypothetical protein
MSKRTIHGIDPYVPGGIDALMAHHRLTFGDAVMRVDPNAAPPATDPPVDPPADPGTPPPADPPAAPPAAPAAPPAPNVWDDPAAAKAEIEKLRRQNGDDRILAKKTAADEARNELLQKLGLTKEGEAQPDPAKLAADLAAERTAKADTARQLAIYKAASTAGADPAKLLDSNSFMTSVQGLDPTDGAAVAAAITAAVTANQSLKAARAAGASGIELSGGTGEQGQITAAQLAHMTAEQIVEADRKGLLRDYKAS